MIEQNNWIQGNVGGKPPYFLRKVLEKNEERNIEWSVIKLKPNTKYPQHSHSNLEWVYVLKGNMEDKNGMYKEGDRLINEIGSEHQVTSGNEGTEIMVFKFLERDLK